MAASDQAQPLLQQQHVHTFGTTTRDAVVALLRAHLSKTDELAPDVRAIVVAFGGDLDTLIDFALAFWLSRQMSQRSMEAIVRDAIASDPVLRAQIQFHAQPDAGRNPAARLQ